MGAATSSSGRFVLGPSVRVDGADRGDQVIDFGIAKATEARLTERTLFTEQRQLIGTPEYMSPEQATGAMAVGPQSDIYALGCVLYEMLTGSPPFEAATPVAVALKHLQELGHKRIAFMRGPEVISDAHYRWQGITKAAKELGLEIHPELTITLPELDQTPVHGYKAMRKLLKSTRDFTAIVAFNDLAAVGAIRALREHGVSVPEDVSVVGFDDFEYAAYHSPSLTTIRQPLHKMGNMAARILLDHIRGKDGFEKEVAIVPELVIRESTAPPPARRKKR